MSVTRVSLPMYKPPKKKLHPTQTGQGLNALYKSFFYLGMHKNGCGWWMKNGKSRHFCARFCISDWHHFDAASMKARESEDRQWLWKNHNVPVEVPNNDRHSQQQQQQQRRA